MSRSPLDFGFLAGAANAIRSGRGRKKLGKRINKLENQMGVLMRDRNSNEADDSGPEFATGLPGSLDPQADAQPDLMPMNSFSPGAIENANSMFGNEIPGSFDKDMGNPLNKKDTFGGTPDKTKKQEAYEEATNQLYKEGKITESDNKADKLIEKRMKENAKKFAKSLKKKK